MIKKDLLEEYSAETVSFSKGDYIFKKGDTAKFYFQIVSGGVKMNNYNTNGNEFIQGIFGKDKSFGEPPLFIDTKYPANSIAINNVIALKLEKSAFKKLLLENSDIHYKFTKLIANRLYYKATIANGITSNSAEEAISTLFSYLKKEVYEETIPFNLKIDLTRKNIAGLVGLSVESTIRTIKKMESNRKLKIVNQKIYY